MYHLLASGSNGSGQLGIGDEEDVCNYTECRLSHQPGSEKESVKDTIGRRRVVDLCSGSGHSLLLLSEAEPAVQSSISRHDDGLNHNPGYIREQKNTLYATGSNNYGQLDPSFPLSNTSWTPLDMSSLLAAAQADLYLPTTYPPRLEGVDGKTMGIRYEPKLIACSWSSGFVCFSRHIALETAGTSDGSAEGHERQEKRLSDIIVSFGTNDFGELGFDAQQGGLDQRRDIGVVAFPWLVAYTSQTDNKEEEVDEDVWMEVVTLKASQRHILCTVKKHRRTASYEVEAEGEISIWGWGAGRHGQSDVRSAVISVGDRTVDQALGQDSPIAADAAEKVLPVSVGATRAEGKAKIKGKSTPYPRSYTIPTSLDVDLQRMMQALPLDEGKQAGDTGSSVVRYRLQHYSLGAGHTVFLFNPVGKDGSDNKSVLVALGNGTKGQKALSHLGTTASANQERSGSQWHDLGCTWNGTYLVAKTEKEVEQIWATGSNTHGQLGLGPENPTDAAETDGLRRILLPAELVLDSETNSRKGRRIKKLICGSEHLIVLADMEDDSQKEVYTWGWNEHGNLGLGDKDDRWDPVRLDRSALGGVKGQLEVVDGWAGCGSSWLLVKTDQE